MKDSETALKVLIEECIDFPEKRKKFIEEGTVELLLRLCCNPETINLQLSNQALAALGILAHENNKVKAKIVGQGTINSILAFCKPRKESLDDVDLSVCHKQLLAHEQASLLVRKLTFENSACQTELINAGALKYLIGLCDVFNPAGKHANCCYINQEFPVEAKCLLSDLTYGKQLIGKVRELVGEEKHEQAKYLSETGCPLVHCYSSSRFLSVELYDTTTDKDIDIGKELVHSGNVWPLFHENMAKPDKGEREDTGSYWQDISVSQVIDGGHFWAHVGGEDVRSRLEELRNELQRQLCTKEKLDVDKLLWAERVNDGKNLPKAESIPQPGDMVCVNGTIGGHRDTYRAVILELAIEQVDYVVKVLAVDYGYISVVPGSTVRLLTAELASVPPQVTPCCLAGVQAPPWRTHVLENAAGALRNLSQENINCRLYIAALEGVEALLKLCRIPNKEICKQAAGALLNLALHSKNRARMGYLGGVSAMFELCQRYPNEDQILELAVGTVQNLMISSTVNRGRVVDSNGLIVLAEIYHSTENENVKQRTLEAVKNLVGSSLCINLSSEEAEQSFEQARGSIDVRNMMEDEVKKRFSLSTPIDDNEPLPGRRRLRRRRRLRKGEVEPNPTRVALPSECIQRAGYSTGESDSENYLSGATSCEDTDGDTDGDNLIGSHSGSASNEGEKDVENERYYVQESKVSFVEDERHELRLQTSVHRLNKLPLAKAVCAFLNSQECGTVYYGIRKDAVVAGIVIDRKETNLEFILRLHGEIENGDPALFQRDQLRIGVDELLDDFSPAVQHDCYKIEFIPVVRKAGHHNPLTRITFQNRFVVEISITKCSDIMYNTPGGKCYLRNKAKNVELNTQDIREKTVREQEAMYNREIKSLCLDIKEMKRQLREKSLERTNEERRHESEIFERCSPKETQFSRTSSGQKDFTEDDVEGPQCVIS